MDVRKSEESYAQSNEVSEILDPVQRNNWVNIVDEVSPKSLIKKA